jgi:hypothetical protein
MIARDFCEFPGDLKWYVDGVVRKSGFAQTESDCCIFFPVSSKYPQVPATATGGILVMYSGMNLPGFYMQ